MKSQTLILLLATSVSMTACGNYSPEDLLFAQAAPTRADVTLVTAGESLAVNAGAGQVQQGLTVCGEQDLRCFAQQTADGLNEMTGNIIAILDEVVKSPPTFRASGRRVWGPGFDNGNTFRVEMTRDDNGNFGVCIHLKVGEIPDDQMPSPETLDCDVQRDASGLLRVLSGAFAPGPAVDGVAAGAGLLIFDGNALAELDPNEGTAGVYAISYDNTVATEHSIHIDITDLPDQGDGFDAAVYEYVRNPHNGEGTFHFKARANFLVDAPFTETPEILDVTAVWNAEQAGRAESQVTGPDLEALGINAFSATHCWNADFSVAYFHDDDADRPDEGVVANCVF